MARFAPGNPGGPGRPPIDSRVKRAREILRECVLPALPGIVEDLLASRDPKIRLEVLRLVLPYLEAPAAISVKAEMKTQPQYGVVEEILLEIWEKDRAQKLAEGSKRNLPQLEAASS